MTAPRDGLSEEYLRRCAENITDIPPLYSDRAEMARELLDLRRRVRELEEALRGLRGHMKKQPGIGDVPRGKCAEVARSYFSIGVVTTAAWVDQYVRAALGEQP